MKDDKDNISNNQPSEAGAKDAQPKESLFDVAASTPARTSGKQTSAFLRRSALEVTHYRVLRKVILISTAILIAVLLLLYAFTLVYDRTGKFTVEVKGLDTSYNITLCENPDFKTYSSLLYNNEIVKMTNICGDDIPKNVDSINGEHNGENYLAYTFYCKNLRSGECSLNYEITFNNVTNGMDESIRVRLYVDGTPTDYAKTRSDGKGKEDHYCDKSFANSATVCYGSTANVAAEGIVRFTIVIWVEGDDVDCNDSIINGSVKFAMNVTAQEPK